MVVVTIACTGHVALIEDIVDRLIHYSSVLIACTGHVALTVGIVGQLIHDGFVLIALVMLP